MREIKIKFGSVVGAIFVVALVFSFLPQVSFAQTNNFVCDSNHTCPSGQVCISGSCLPDTSGTGVTTPASGNCGDPSLESINGICVPKGNFPVGSVAGSKTLVGLILLVLQYLLILSGLVAVLALVIGGFWYITAAGNEEQAEKGRKALTNAIIGMVIIIMAYAIVNILSQTLTTTNITSTTGQ